MDLEDLHRLHARAIRAYVLRRADPSSADEVCADVWSTAWRRLDSIPADDPLPWLVGVARKALANHRRAARRRDALWQRVLERGGSAVHHVPAPALPSDRELARALASLKPMDREALLLIAWEELSPAQAAASLGISAGAFSVRLHRARQRLSAVLDAPQTEPTKEHTR